MGIGQCSSVGPTSRNWKGGLTVNMKEYRILHEATRRAQKNKSFGVVTVDEWKEIKRYHNHTCLSCGRKEPEISLTQDHIIPLSKGGSNFSNNIQPLCRKCNARKYTRTIYFEYGVEITDIDAIPLEYMKIDYRKIGGVVRALREQTKIPGVKVYAENNIAAGRR
jgi:hypothetical protein